MGACKRGSDGYNSFVINMLYSGYQPECGSRDAYWADGDYRIQTGFTPPTLTGHPELGLSSRAPFRGAFFWVGELVPVESSTGSSSAADFFKISHL